MSEVNCDPWNQPFVSRPINVREKLCPQNGVLSASNNGSECTFTDGAKCKAEPAHIFGSSIDSIADGCTKLETSTVLRTHWDPTKAEAGKCLAYKCPSGSVRANVQGNNDPKGSFCRRSDRLLCDLMADGATWKKCPTFEGTASNNTNVSSVLGNDGCRTKLKGYVHGSTCYHPRISSTKSGPAKQYGEGFPNVHAVTDANGVEVRKRCQQSDITGIQSKMDGGMIKHDAERAQGCVATDCDAFHLDRTTEPGAFGMSDVKSVGKGKHYDPYTNLSHAKKLENRYMCIYGDQSRPLTAKLQERSTDRCVSVAGKGLCVDNGGKVVDRGKRKLCMSGNSPIKCSTAANIVKNLPA